MSFDLATEQFIDLYGGEMNAVPDLGGLSGAPIWTFDIEDGYITLRFVGVHSASNSEVALGVHVEQHSKLLRDRGWISRDQAPGAE